MKLILIGIIVFLVILYIYTYVRYKKMKNSRISAVEDFKNKYHKKTESSSKKQSDSLKSYTTKYNSTLDYVDRKKLAEETMEMKQPKIVPKKLRF